MKYVPGLAVGQLSGSAGNTTASHNRFGAYLRTRTIPVNPDTTFQLLVRANFSTISAAWRGLTAAQRGDWATLGAQIQRLDSLGVAYNLTGAQAFMLVNAHRLLDAQPIISNAPILTTLPDLDTLSAAGAEASQTLSVTFTPSPLEPGLKLEVWAARPRSVGRVFVGPREFRRLLITPDEQISPVPIAAAYIARFGALSAGERIPIRARVFTQTYIPGRFLRADAIITAI